MADYLDLSAFGPKAIVVALVVLILAYFIWTRTRRFLLTSALVLALAAAGAWYVKILTPAHVERAKSRAMGKLEGASAKAKAIGGQAYSTSAGEAGTTNEAFKSNIDNDIQKGRKQ
jgi:hypothetical protein